MVVQCQWPHFHKNPPPPPYWAACKVAHRLTNLLLKELKKKFLIKQELLKKRKEYSNNKNVYSLLMQYAAGFGKSNIIGWTALQLKDLRRNDEYMYDKIMIVVDRLQLRSQIDSLMLNMNIDNRMYVISEGCVLYGLEARAPDNVPPTISEDVLEIQGQRRVVEVVGIQITQSKSQRVIDDPLFVGMIDIGKTETHPP